MKSLLIIIVAFTFQFVCYGQEIKGLVKNENGVPLSGATVTMLRDSAIMKIAITSSDGSYAFQVKQDGIYKITATYSGYNAGSSERIQFKAANIIVADIKLRKKSASLNAINITTQKPLVEVKADKMIVNVEGTTNAIGLNALELLRRSPGVLLDKDDAITMAGKNGVQIYIDGRVTPLSGQDLANYLKTVQSSQIESIELITNPSAKYDAAGNAGIINIRLVRNKSLGTNGSINGGWNKGVTSKYNGGATLNYRNKHINLFSTYSYNYSPNEQHASIYRTIADSIFDQSNLINETRRSHNYKTGVDYFINKASTVGIIVNGVFASADFSGNNQTFISNQTTGKTDRILKADNNSTSKRSNTNLNLNYTFNGAKGTSLIVNADRGAFTINTDQMQRNYFSDPAGQNNSSIIYHILSPADIKIHSVKADYEQNFGKGKIGIGTKVSIVNTDNDFKRYNVNGSSEDLDKARSNHFIYKENINAVYINYNRKYKKFMIQAGLRAENTEATGTSDGMKLVGSDYVESSESFKRSYIDFFPSAAITFNKNPKRLWSITYSRRIDRPAYQDLNPFEFKLDEYTFMKGNVNLQPQYTNSFGITHTYNYKINFSLNYSHVKDLFTQILDSIEKSKAIFSKKNLATQDIVNFNVSIPYQHKSYSLFTSVGSNYATYKANFGKGRTVDIASFGFNLFLQNSIKFCKTWTGELSGFFNSPTIYMGSFIGKSIYNVDAGLSKLVLKGKGTIKASVSDVFHTMQFRATSEFAGQYTAVKYRQESQQFKLNFSYRFGSNVVKPARQRTSGAEEELKRVQQSGGIIGN